MNISELRAQFIQGTYTPTMLMEQVFLVIKNKDREIKAFLEIYKETALAQAQVATAPGRGVESVADVEGARPGRVVSRHGARFRLPGASGLRPCCRRAALVAAPRPLRPHDSLRNRCPTSGEKQVWVAMCAVACRCVPQTERWWRTLTVGGTHGRSVHGSAGGRHVELSQTL